MHLLNQSKKAHSDTVYPQFPITALREIKILQVLKNDNIVNLLEICRAKGNMEMATILICTSGISLSISLFVPSWIITYLFPTCFQYSPAVIIIIIIKCLAELHGQTCFFSSCDFQQHVSSHVLTSFCTENCQKSSILIFLFPFHQTFQLPQWFPVFVISCGEYGLL